MDEARYETLLDENTNLKKALSSTKHVLERTLNDYETLRQIHEDFKNQYDKLKRENEEGHQKYFQLLNDKKEIENQFDNTIRNFKIAIEQKQKELEDVQAKVIPSLDYDMMRIKVINELEGPHRLALESKQQEIEKLQDQVYELKRQVEILNSKYEAVKFEAEKDIRDLKERHKFEINDLMLEIQALQERVEDTRDKEIIRNMRRELDELKFRFGENENEMEELQREKERLREEKNDILIKLNKQLEIEKNERRNYKAENEKLTIKLRQIENNMSIIAPNHTSHTGDKYGEISKLERENERLRHDNEDKLKQINLLQTQVRDLEEGQIAAQTKLQEYISQSQLQNHEKHISEKNRIAALQREMESYQKTIVELENKHRNTNFQTSKDLEIQKQENSRLTETYYQIQRNLEAKEEEVNKLRRELENLQDELYYTQKKNKDLTLQKDTSASPATGLGNRPVGRESELLRDALQREEKLKNKVVQLKAKLRAANKKILELLPHKILAQKDGNMMMAHPGAVPIYSQGPPGDIVQNLKAKYGIVDNIGPNHDILPPPVSDVKMISAKYGFGLGAQPIPPIPRETYKPEMDRLLNKYTPEEPIPRVVLPRDEVALQAEIERTAEEAFKRYGVK